MKAFTLIELLIVVAIIAILAAVAVPNFLEAQTRAKISRVKNDMRCMATALESYCVDHNGYPPNYDTPLYPGGPGDESRVFASLTSPVAFLTNVPRDVFRPDVREPHRGTYYEYIASDTVFALPQYKDSLAPWYRRTGTRWSLASVGPDRRNQYVGHQLPIWAVFTYDPTNGSVSRGDLWRTNRGQLH